MIEAEEDGDRLSTVELNAQITLLFIAGHETTVNLIGTGFYELMRNPEQLVVWREDPDVAVNAVDELLRYVSPVQMSRRVALTDIEFSGVEIPARAFVLAVLASANRDPGRRRRSARSPSSYRRPARGLRQRSSLLPGRVVGEARSTSCADLAGRAFPARNDGGRSRLEWPHQPARPRVVPDQRLI